MASKLRFLRPKYYAKRVRGWWLRRNYDVVAAASAEIEKFQAAGFNREQGLLDLDIQLSAMGQPNYKDSAGIASVHWLLFACLAKQRQIGRILEIGTFDGQTTALLAGLFPSSHIVTLDLPPNDPILQATYGRSSHAALTDYERRLAQNTISKNITLLRANSVFLPSIVSGRFDLIWVDGGHLYPEIAWDLCNSWNLLEKGGTLMCDDVLPNASAVRDGYVSPDSYRVLDYIRTRTGDRLWLFLKREQPEWSADPLERKFVAMMRKATSHMSIPEHIHHDH